MNDVGFSQRCQVLETHHKRLGEWHHHVSELFRLKRALGPLCPVLPRELVDSAPVAPAVVEYLPLPPTEKATPAPTKVSTEKAAPAPTKAVPTETAAPARPRPSSPKVPQAGSNLRALYDRVPTVPATAREVRALVGDALPPPQVSPGLISLHKRGLISRHDIMTSRGTRRPTKWSRPAGNDTTVEAAPPAASSSRPKTWKPKTHEEGGGGDKASPR